MMFCQRTDKGAATGVGIRTLLFVLLCLLFAVAASALGPGVAAAEEVDLQPLKNLEIGDRVMDPTWAWEFRRRGDYSPVEPIYEPDDEPVLPVVWIVVAKDHYGKDTGVTLLAQDLIGLFAFDNSNPFDWPWGSRGGNRWDKSGTHATATRGLRPWLNSTGIHSGEGFYQAFSPSFKEALITVTIPNLRFEWPRTDYGEPGIPYVTEDLVFIPSTTELGDIEHWNTEEVGTAFPYFEGAGDEFRKAAIGGTDWKRNYWTRSPGAGDGAYHYHRVAFVMNGGFHSADAYIPEIGARPLLNLNADTPVSKTPNAYGIYLIGGGESKFPLLEGKVTSGMNLFGYSPGDVPMPYMQVELAIKDEEDDQVLIEFDTVTDREGKYSFFIDESELKKLIDEDEGETLEDIFPLEAELSVIYDYHRDELNYFTMHLHGQADLIPTLTVPVTVDEFGMEFDLEIGEEVEEPSPGVRCNTASLGLTEDADPVSDYYHLTPIYYHTHEALEFALQHLEMGEELAGLAVRVGGAGGAYYNPSGNGLIVIGNQSADFSSPNRPKNREYHEFAHHIMYRQYGDWSAGNDYTPAIELKSPPYGSIDFPGGVDAVGEHTFTTWALIDLDPPPQQTVYFSSSNEHLLQYTIPENADAHIGKSARYAVGIRHGDSAGNQSGWHIYGIIPPLSRNHDGFLNPSTSDSYDEGFAEFMALLMSKYREHAPDPEPHIYVNANIESMYKAWGGQGKDEELAICGILWSLYNEKHGISLELDQIWDILKERLEDQENPQKNGFYQYYLAFQEAFEDKRDEINNIFIWHGFFADRLEGNKQFDKAWGEAYRQAFFEEPEINKIIRYYIDYGFVKLPGLYFPIPVYIEGDKIGQATNYERPWRYSAVHHPQGFIKVSDDEIRRYRVQVSFHEAQNRPPALIYRKHLGGKMNVSLSPPLENYEYVTARKSGKIAVGLPPKDTRATITIIPESKDYTAEHIYIIDSTDAYSKLYEATGGYFDAHTFNLSPTGTNLDEPYVLIDGVEPEYIVEDRYHEEEETDPLPYHWISTVANPEDGGTVNGEGIYADGEQVTVTAEANPGYLFVNWTDAGGEVSTSAEYTFIAEDYRLLTANFRPEGQKVIYVQNYATGEIAAWLIDVDPYDVDESQITETVQIGMAPEPQASWRITAVYDIENNGSPDLLWHNSETGERRAWIMERLVKADDVSYGAQGRPNLVIVGLHDMDGDGNPDAILQNRHGRSLIWFMDRYTKLEERHLAFSNPNWANVGAADMGADGYTNIIWENKVFRGRNYWTLDDNYERIEDRSEQFYFTGTAWQIVALHDMDGDGKPDIIWEHIDDGRRTIWLITDMQQSPDEMRRGIFATKDPAWSIVGAGTVRSD